MIFYFAECSCRLCTVVAVVRTSCVVVAYLGEPLRRMPGKVCVTVVFGKSDCVIVSVPLSDSGFMMYCMSELEKT